jgi:hypothetical protein
VSSVAPDGRAIPTRGAWLIAGRRQRADHARHNPSSISFVLLLGVIALPVALAVTMQTTNYDIWGGVLVGSVLLLLTVPLATRAARRQQDPRIGRIILFALFVKLSVGTIARYVVAFYVYKSSDAGAYFNAGRLYAPRFRAGDFTNLGKLVGTGFVEVLSGIVIAAIDETRLGEFMVFSWLAFLGLYLFYQAFRIAFPEGDHRRYCLLVFFWPSLLFWPSSVGKDAWMVFMLGMCALGVANLLVGRWRGFAWLAVGCLGSIMVRPHVALIVIAAFAIALVLRRNRGTYARMLARPVGTIVLVTGMIIGGAVIFQQTQSFFKLDSLDLESAQTVLENTTDKTAEGGSSFTPATPTSPLGYLEGAITVMFRPLPTEVAGAALLSGLEGVLLAGLVVVSWKRVVRIVRMSLRNAYVAFAVGYSAVFIFAFSSISNFGILARERSQFFPVLFVLLAIPKRTRGTNDEPDDATNDPALVAAG